MTREEILDATDRRWDFSDGVPVPRSWWRCGSCGHDIPQVRSWSFGRYTDGDFHRVMARCDVSLKCTECALVTTHGIAIPDEIYDAREVDVARWRDIR